MPFSCFWTMATGNSKKSKINSLITKSVWKQEKPQIPWTFSIYKEFCRFPVSGHFPCSGEFAFFAVSGQVLCSGDLVFLPFHYTGTGTDTLLTVLVLIIVLAKPQCITMGCVESNRLPRLPSVRQYLLLSGIILWRTVFDDDKQRTG